MKVIEIIALLENLVKDNELQIEETTKKIVKLQEKYDQATKKLELFSRAKNFTYDELYGFILDEDTLTFKDYEVEILSELLKMRTKELTDPEELEFHRVITEQMIEDMIKANKAGVTYNIIKAEANEFCKNINKKVRKNLIKKGIPVPKFIENNH